jgi:hypothetical protein
MDFDKDLYAVALQVGSSIAALILAAWLILVVIIFLGISIYMAFACPIGIAEIFTTGCF